MRRLLIKKLKILDCVLNVQSVGSQNEMYFIYTTYIFCRRHPPSLILYYVQSVEISHAPTSADYSTFQKKTKHDLLPLPDSPELPPALPGPGLGEPQSLHGNMISLSFNSAE